MLLLLLAVLTFSFGVDAKYHSSRYVDRTDSAPPVDESDYVNARRWQELFYSKHLSAVNSKIEETINVTQGKWNTIPGNTLHVGANMQGFFGVWYMFADFGHCISTAKLGGSSMIGDGGKYVCNPHRIRSPCLIYSMGVNQDITFETQFLDNVAKCEIFAFDPAPHVAQNVELQSSLKLRNISFFPYGIGKTNTLNQIMHMTNKLDRDGNPMLIDILKMDIEGGEFEFLDWFTKSCAAFKINQILIEFHLEGIENKVMWNHLQSLWKCGFRIFHKDPNRISDTDIDTRKGSCFEVAFVHERLVRYRPAH